jgi:NitT/TauT family transport system substrate-binding protein
MLVDGRRVVTRCLGWIALGSLSLLGAAAHAETITVTHWGNVLYGAPFAVAMEKGFFKEAGVDIDGIVTASGGGTAIRNTLAGTLPYGEVGTAAVIDAMKAGFPIEVVNTGVWIADTAWVAKPDSPLNSIKDLAGKKVGVSSPNGGTAMYLLRALKASGIDPSSVDMVPVGSTGSSISAVMTGAVDTSYITEPARSSDKTGLKVIFELKDVLPRHNVETVGIVTTDFAKQHPDEVRAIVAGRRKGVDFIYQHPDEAADITAAAYHSDPAIMRKVFERYVGLDYWSRGDFDIPGMDAQVEGLQIIGQQKGPVDWSKVLDPSFLPDDLKPKN